MKHLKFDLDNIIDDLICLLFFVGNDFLPRLYCFDIKSDNLERLLSVFYHYYIDAKTYINTNGNINPEGF